MEQIQKLQELDCSTVKRFSFDGIDTYARIVNIHDPDTFTIIFSWKDSFIKANIRLEGIDAPELHSEVEAERSVCLKGIDALNKIIGDKVVRVMIGKMDKYGRILSTIYTLDGLNINQYLIDNNYVRDYDGGHKGPWTYEELALAGSKNTPVDTPAPDSVDTPASASIDTPASASIDTPASASVDTPASASVDTLASASIDTPASASVDTPILAPVETIIDTAVASIDTTAVASVLAPVETIVDTTVVAIKIKKQSSLRTKKTRITL